MADLTIFAAAHDAAAGTVAHGAGAAVEHAAPTALGLGAAGWVAVAMLILIGIMLWKKVPALVGQMLDGKIATIRQQLDEAESIRRDAEALKAEYAQRIGALSGEADAMRARAEEDAAAIVAKAKIDAEQLIARRQKMAEDRIAAAERGAVADVRNQAANAATAAAQALIAERHDVGADRPLVDAAIAEIGRV